MTPAIISSEATCILFSIIMLYGNTFEVDRRTRRTNSFSLAVLTGLVAMIFDMFSWMTENDSHLETINFSMTVLSIVLSFAVSAAFIYFFYLHITSKVEVSPILFNILIIYSIAALVVFLILCLHGKVFTISEGVYTPGEYYPLYLVATNICVLFGITITIIYSKKLGRHDTIAILSFFVLPTICVIINFFYEYSSFSYPAITISFLLVYVMLRSESEEMLIKEDIAVSHQANHDSLTGLQNRRAFSQKVDLCKTSSGIMGVVFCDVNGLKYTNDTFGHERGDKLLCDFADMMKSCFREDEIYRVGGDEFVVLLPDITKPPLVSRLEKLHSIISSDNRHIASVGYICGDKQNIDALISKAEENMYIDKRSIYETCPEFNRKR